MISATFFLPILSCFNFIIFALLLSLSVFVSLPLLLSQCLTLSLCLSFSVSLPLTLSFSLCYPPSLSTSLSHSLYFLPFLLLSKVLLSASVFSTTSNRREDRESILLLPLCRLISAPTAFDKLFLSQYGVFCTSIFEIKRTLFLNHKNVDALGKIVKTILTKIKKRQRDAKDFMK